MFENILILTCEEDPHADFVLKHLDEFGVNSLRVNTDKLIGNYDLDISKEVRISDFSRSVVVDKSWSIWNRRILEPDIEENIDDKLKNIIYDETRKTWEGILLNHDSRVVNNPVSNFVANNKINQHHYVSKNKFGVRVPNQIISNKSDTVLRFYDELKHSNKYMSHKLQKGFMVEKEGEYYTIYNNIVKEDNLKNIDSIKFYPAYFQEYIDKKFELRITALEDKVIATEIHSQLSDISKEDFRKYDFKNVKYKIHDTPKSIEDFCVDILKNYDLKFGQIDMIVNKNNEYVFLEINPNGQWLWLELMTGYELSKDVAYNLIKNE